jgi:hypothetical protein
MLYYWVDYFLWISIKNQNNMSDFDGFVQGVGMPFQAGFEFVTNFGKALTNALGNLGNMLPLILVMLLGVGAIAFISK